MYTHRLRFLQCMTADTMMAPMARVINDTWATVNTIITVVSILVLTICWTLTLATMVSFPSFLMAKYAPSQLWHGTWA